MSRPLRIDGTSGLIEMSDADLDRLCYYLRVAYATQLNTNGQGSLNVGGSGTTIGTMSDTSRTQRVNTGSNVQPYPGTGTETDASFTYKQIRTYPSSPSNSILNSESFVIVDSTSGTITATEAQIAATVIAQTITDMRTGDEVGTYRVATSNPGGGTWIDKGIWFVDTTYTGSTTYKLWLKTAHNSIPGSNVYPVAIDGVSGLREQNISSSSNLIQNILLPILTRDMFSNTSLFYNQSTSSVGVNRGIINDTRLASTSNTQSNPPAGTDPGPSDIYRSFSTPSGSATVFQAQYFYLN